VFGSDRPAIDLLSGSSVLRRLLEASQPLDVWIDSWRAVESAFREERREVLIYP